MTHAQLVQRAIKWLLNIQKCSFALPEYVAYVDTGEIADALGFRATVGKSILIECKVSREDFRKDAQKVFRKLPELGMGDFRYYITPPELIKPEEIPARWGLLYAGPGQVLMVKKAEKIGANLKAERAVYGSVLRRAHLRGHIPQYLSYPIEQVGYGAAIELINEEIG